MVIVLLGLALYGLLFLTTPLPSLAGLGADDRGPLRGAFVLHALLLPDQIVQSWLGDPPGFSLLDRLPVLLITATILATAAALGYLVNRSLRADRGLSLLESTLLAIAVGLVALSNYVLLIGLLGRLRSVWLFTVPGIVVLIVAGGRIAVRSRRATAAGGATAARLQPPAAALIDPRWLWLAAPFVLVTLLGGLLPPVEFDVREYHLEAPKEFFAAGRIGFLPHNVYGNMPLGTEMFALLGMVLSGDWKVGALVGKALIALFLPLTGLTLLAAGQRLFSRTAGMVAAMVYVSIPWMVRVSTLGLVEGAYGFYLFMALYAIVLWTRAGHSAADSPPADRAPTSVSGQARSGPRDTCPADSTINATSILLLAGLMAGGAMSCKYPAVVFVFLPLATWVLFARRRFHWRALAMFTCAALLGCGLWYGKNLALTGNPVYPLAYRVFGGENWSPTKDNKWRAAHGPDDFSAHNAASHVADVAVRSQWLSPLIMPFAVLSLLATRRRRLVLWLWCYFLYVIAAWWLLTHRIDRFWIPALPIVAILAGVGATWTGAPFWRRIFVPIVVLGLAFCLLLDVSGPGGYNRYFVSYARLWTSAERVDPWHAYLNTHVPHGSSALLVGDAQVFDLAVPVIYNTVFDDCIFEQAARGRSPESLHRWLLDQQISHIYVHWGEIARYRGPGNYGFTGFVQPQVFRRLVEKGVLIGPAPAIEGHAGEVYHVAPLR